MVIQIWSVYSSDSNVEPTSPPHPHLSPTLKTSREATAVLTFCSPWICLFLYSCSILCVVRKCLRIVLKCQRLILMEQKRPRKPTDEWICQRIFKSISSSLVCKRQFYEGKLHWPRPREAKIFFILCHTSVVTYFVLHVVSLIFALTLRERSAQTWHDVSVFLALVSA